MRKTLLHSCPIFVMRIAARASLSSRPDSELPGPGCFNLGRWGVVILSKGEGLSEQCIHGIAEEISLRWQFGGT